MTVNRGWAAQVKAVLEEARPRQPVKGISDSEAWRRFEAEHRLQAPEPLEQSARARRIREINRIALRYGWPQPIAEALDAAGVGALGDLADDQLDDLAGRMHRLVDSALNACDLEDTLPAR
ncbi:MAG: hypothetical protein NVV60_01645 [Luteimonas sp.]|nr:hypothetical protein [Luteimonas sp.]